MKKNLTLCYEEKEDIISVYKLLKEKGIKGVSHKDIFVNELKILFVDNSEVRIRSNKKSNLNHSDIYSDIIDGFLYNLELRLVQILEKNKNIESINVNLVPFIPNFLIENTTDETYSLKEREEKILKSEYDKVDIIMDSNDVNESQKLKVNELKESIIDIAQRYNKKINIKELKEERMKRVMV